MRKPNHPPSLAARISALEVGQSACETRRLDVGFMTADDLTTGLNALRNLVNPNVKIARERTGGDYTVETGDFMNRDRSAIFLVVAITRTK